MALPSPTIKFERHLKPLLLEAMADTPTVLINGPRQSGKTTLAQAIAGDLPYISLDDPGRLAAAKADPVGFIRQLDCAIIDEIQRAPDLMLPIKRSIDEDRRPGRFLLTGSANVMSLPTIADSLAGRIEIHALLPLSNAEICGHPANFLEVARAQIWTSHQRPSPTCTGNALIDRVLAGGFPEMRERATPQRQQAWARNYITTLVERDIQDIARVDEASLIPRLLAILATLSGQLLNLSQIGGQLGLNLRTVERYVDVLEKLFLVRRLPAWHRNELSRLIKAPKIHFIDAGLQAALIRSSSALIQSDRRRFGPMLESWVFGELLKLVNLSPERWFLAHYRDKDQVEVDFVLESASRNIIGIEVKAAATISAADFKGLRRLREQSRADFELGLVLYDGDTALSFGEGLWAVPVSWL